MSLYLSARRGDIGRLRDALHSDKPAIRRRAAELLGEVAEPDEIGAIDDLLSRALDDADPEVREAAVSALDSVGPEALDRLVAHRGNDRSSETPALTVGACKRVLTAERPELRLAALHGLGRLGEPSGVPAVVSALSDEDPRVRRRACRVCGSIEDTRCVEPLVERLEDHNPIRHAATIALGQIASNEACDALLTLLDSPDAAVRRDAARALGQAHEQRAVDELIEMVDDEDVSVAEAAFGAVMEMLPELGSQRADVRAELADRLDSRTVGQIRQQLHRMADADRRPALRSDAVWIISETIHSNDGAAVDILIEALESDDEDVREVARKGLLTVGGNRIRRRLLWQLRRQPPAHARASIALLLGQIGGDRVRETLETLANDEEPTVRKRAYEAIEQLADSPSL